MGLETAISIPQRRESSRRRPERPPPYRCVQESLRVTVRL